MTVVVLLTTFLRRMLGDLHAAESIARDSYAEVKRVIDPSSSATSRALLFDTATKHAIAHIRRRRTAPVGIENAGSMSDAPPEVEQSQEPVGPRHLAVMERFGHHLKEAMLQLPEPTRQIFNLHRADRLSASQIAERLSLDVDVVARHIRLAQVLCVNELEKRGVHSLDP